MKKSWIVLVIILIVLIITNPGKENFYDWAGNRALQESASTLEGVMERIVKTPILRTATVRRDYVIFSVFIIEFEEEKDVYLGILRQFIKIRSGLDVVE